MGACKKKGIIKSGMKERIFSRILLVKSKFKTTAINEITACVLVFFLPILKPHHYSYILALSFLANFIKLKSQGNKFKFQNTVKFIPFFLYFFASVVGLFFSADIRRSLADLEKHLYYLIIPFLLLITGIQFGSNSRMNLMISFVLGNVITILICLFFAAKRNFDINEFALIIPEVYSYHDLGLLFDLHATYFGIYVNFSIVILFELFFNFKKIKLLTFLGSLTLLLMTISLLQSRIVFLTLIFLIFFLCFHHHKNFKLRFSIINLFLLGFITIILISVMFLKGNLSTRLNEILNFNKNDLVGSSSENGVSQRVFLWERSAEAIVRSPIYGYGTGGDIEALKESMEIYLNDSTNKLTKKQKDGIEPFMTLKLNSHNQFLTDVLMFGLFGGLILIFIIINGLVFALRNRDFSFLLFLLIIALSCLTESILARQKGIAFFTLYYCIFFAQKTESQTPIPQIKIE